MFGTHLSRLGSVHRLGLVHKAIGILRKYGTDAHIYLPGIGTVSGITAGNYLDSAGTTAASVDNPVGLSLDALQAMTLGSELVTNGTNLVTTTGWTATALSGAPASLSVSGGSLVVTNTGTTYGAAAQTVAVTAGKTYLVSARLTKGTAAAANIRVGSTVFGYEYADQQAATGGTVPITCVFKATSGSVFITLLNANTTDGTGAYNNISVREIPGVRATQSTTANKPILRRGLLNQLTYSQDASNAAWAKISASATASKIIEAAGSSQHYISQSIDMPDGGVTFAAAFAPAERSWVTMYLGTPNTSAWFNVSTGVIGTTLASVTASIASLPNGYKLCVINGSQSSVAAITRGLYIADSDGNNTYTGDGTSGILFGGAGLFQGTYTAQQILDAGGIPLTTTAAASNANAGRYSWQFDGSNDYLSLGAPLFQMSDDHCVIAGVNCASTDATQLVVQPSGVLGSLRAGTLQITSTGFSQAIWHDGTNTNVCTASSGGFGTSKVLTARKTSTSGILRENGIQQGSAVTITAAGVSTGGSIGAYLSGEGHFQGSIYPVIAIKGTVSDADLLTLERFVGQLSGVSI